jgi:hypothetical protein
MPETLQLVLIRQMVCRSAQRADDPMILVYLIATVSPL